MGFCLGRGSGPIFRMALRIAFRAAMLGRP
jgi:hypothetical protein